MRPLVLILRLGLAETSQPVLQGAKMMSHDWSDEELFRRLQQRDPDALETLISRYTHLLSDWIYLVLDGVGTAQDVEVCLNDLFAAIWQEIETYDAARGTLQTWLTLRAKYLALDRRRQLSRKRRQGENGEIIDP